MASPRQSLSCTICFDPFKDPTILMCGHTFCRGCLERCARHNRNIYHIICPICRGRTNLGQHRVAGLAPNLSLRDIQVELREDDRKMHCRHYYGNYCEACDKFICHCELNDHKDHNLKKKDEMIALWKNKQASLFENGRALITDVEKCIKEAEKQRELIQCYFGNLEVQIRDEFAKKVMILERDQDKLLKLLEHRYDELDGQMRVCILDLSNEIRITNDGIRYLTAYLGDENLDMHWLRAHDHVRMIESALKKQSHKNNRTADFIRAAEKAQFHPADVMILDLGYLEM